MKDGRYMDFKEVVETRRSIRTFTGKEVSNETITELVECAKYAPSWKNTQVTRYYAIKSEEIKNKIVEALPDFNKNAGTTAPVIIVASVVKLRSGYNRQGEFDSPKGKGWQMYDCGCSNMLFTLKANELGLGTVIMGLYDEDAIAEAINLPETEEIISVIALGYYENKPEMPPRKGSEIILNIL